jgi:carbon-monoxide dehydrogenase large subunit
VEIAVNTETGEIRVVNAAIAADMGFPINPKMCEGQIEGGLCMAIGASILEEYLYQDGLMINASYGDYRIPTIGEVPAREKVHSAFAPDPLPDGPWGAKGIGEGTMISVAPAIANALYASVGLRVKDLPLSAERVLRLLREKKEKEQRRNERG